jgi:transketolase
MRAMRDVWGQALVDEANHDPRIVVLDGDLGNSTKADKFAAAHPDRFLQMGIAEQNLVGVAAGLASLGYIPWTSTFAVFLTHRAADPIRMLVAQSHANVKIAGSYTGLLIGAVGKTHLDIQDLAIMRAMPDMTVLAPADASELLSVIKWANAYDGPVYLRLTRDPGPDVFGPDYEFELGRVRTLRRGSRVALVSTGPQTVRTLAAADLLTAQGLDPTVLHLPTIKPVDEAGLLAALEGHELVVTTEEHTVLGGLGGLVAEILTTAGPSPAVERIGIDDTWGESADNAYLLEKHGLSAERISDRALLRLSSPVTAGVR